MTDPLAIGVQPSFTFYLISALALGFIIYWIYRFDDKRKEQPVCEKCGR